MGPTWGYELREVPESPCRRAQRVVVMKPEMDARFGTGTVKSRAGLERGADVLLTEDHDTPLKIRECIIAATWRDSDASAAGELLRKPKPDCILVDEAQFLSPRTIEALKEIATRFAVPVICYGLRTDFRSQLFPGSKRLFELADTIEEVKTTCTFCNRKATMNLRMVCKPSEDKPTVGTFAGPVVCLGGNDMYAPMCYEHFTARIQAGDTKTESPQEKRRRTVLEDPWEAGDVSSVLDFVSAWKAADELEASWKAADELEAE